MRLSPPPSPAPGASLGLGAMLLLIGLLLSPQLAQARTPTASPDRCREDYIAPEAIKDSLTLTMLGVACFERGEFGRALVFYRRAYTRSKEPLLEAAIGRSLHELGIWSAARAYYELYLQHETVDTDGRARIEERLQRLDAQLAKEAASVSIDVFPGSADAYIQTHEGHRELIGPTPITVSLEARKYTIYLEQKGFHPAEATVNLSPEEHVALKQELVPQRATFDLTTRSTRRIGATTMLVGAPILTAGAVFTLLADHDRTRRQGQAVMIVGGSAILVGGIISLIGYRRERKLRLDHTSLTLSSTLSPTFGSISLSW